MGRKKTNSLGRLSEHVGALLENGRMDMRTVVMTIWRARDRSDLVSSVSEFLKDRSASKDLVKDVELYLPQLVHLILHLEVNWGDEVLQEFAYMVCQISIHFGLQMYWILIGASQDYAMEDVHGHKNPRGNEVLFMRCVTMLQSIERAIVYFDSPEVLDIEEDYRNGNITKEEMDRELALARANHAKEVLEFGKDEAGELEGDLLYKRWIRTNALATKGWNTRHFVLKGRFLLCYNGNSLRRAIPLWNCDVIAKDHRNKEWYFEVQERGTERVFKLAALNEATRDKWIKHLTAAADSPPKFSYNAALTEHQKNRWNFLKGELEFVTKLTMIAEEMRFETPEDRKGSLKRAMLKLCRDTDFEKLGLYLPIGMSTDPVYIIKDGDANACIPFSTKERCPCLMTFLVKKPNHEMVAGSAPVDVANFLYEKYHEEVPESTGVRLKRQFSGLTNQAENRPSLWTEEEAVTSMSHTVIPNEDGKMRIIVKSHDDLRQEVFIMQLIQFIKDTWHNEGLDLWVHPYRILSTSQDTGLIEVIEDANSLDGIKKGYHEDGRGNMKLLEHFKEVFPNKSELAEARRRFTESLAGYSVVCYILGIKDRHNGNIMLRKDGRIVHIDFGFVLGQAPGKNKVAHTDFSLERAAFKLTSEMVEVIGDNWGYFNQLCIDGLMAIRKKIETLVTLVEISGYKANYPCFNEPGYNAKRVVKELRARALMHITEEDQVASKMTALIDHAKDSKLTKLYESFQMKTNGIRPSY